MNSGWAASGTDASGNPYSDSGADGWQSNNSAAYSHNQTWPGFGSENYSYYNGGRLAANSFAPGNTGSGYGQGTSPTPANATPAGTSSTRPAGESGGGVSNPLLLSNAPVQQAANSSSGGSSASNGPRAPQGTELQNIKTAIDLLKANTKYAKFGELMEQMLANGKILVTDLGFKTGSGVFGQTRAWTNNGAIEIDQNFAAIASRKSPDSLAALAETLVHEWSHLTTYEGNPTGTNWFAKIFVGGLLPLVPAGRDADGSFRSLAEIGPHNLGADVRQRILADLKNSKSKPPTTMPAPINEP
jgi:hypothetical protein